MCNISDVFHIEFVEWLLHTTKKMYSELIAVTVTIGCAIFIQSEKKDPEKISGVYSNGGKWYYLKYLTVLFFLYLRRTLRGFLNGWIRDKKDLIGIERTRRDKFEKLQPLGAHKGAFDGVSFQAVSRNGTCIHTAFERVHGGKANTFFYLMDPQKGRLLRSENLPDCLTSAFPNTLLKHTEYSTKDITIAPLKPMKSWKIEYTGKMRSEEMEQPLQVSFVGEWTSQSDYIHFNEDFNEKLSTKALSPEVWTQDFFENLKQLHSQNTHYEQFGKIEGNLVVGDDSKFVQFDCIRKHTFGERIFEIHRYVSFSIFMADSTRISLTIISIPTVLTHLQIGYVIEFDSNDVCMITDSNFLLFENGESGEPPSNLTFTIKTSTKSYEISSTVLTKSVHYIGHNGESSRVIECFVNCEVDGIVGKGIFEWFYTRPNNL